MWLYLNKYIYIYSKRVVYIYIYIYNNNNNNNNNNNLELSKTLQRGWTSFRSKTHTNIHFSASTKLLQIP